MSLITEYVAFAQKTRFEDLAPDILHLARCSIIDTVGVACMGSGSASAAPFVRYANTHLRGRSEAGVMGCDLRLPASGAAFVNGALAHLDDYDEVSLPGHTAVVAVPTALALAEAFDLSGRELLRVYTLGIELVFRLASAMADRLWTVGWHTTPVFGIMGSATMAALAMGLDEKRFANALSLAASRASGLQANFGTLAKPFHVGMAASGGIDCALLAACGVDGHPAALEAPCGYAACFTGGAGSAVQGLPEGLGDGWEIARHGMLFKQYPCCVSSHAAINTFTRLVSEHGLGVDDVTAVHVGLDPSAQACMRYAMPENSLQARFSMAFPLAMVLRNGSLSIADFCDANVQNPLTRQIMGTIRSGIDDDLRGVFLSPDQPCTLRVVTTQGAVLEAQGRLPYFGPACWDNTIRMDAVAAKYTACVNGVLHPEAAQAALTMMAQMEDLPYVGPLMTALTTR